VLHASNNPSLCSPRPPRPPASTASTASTITASEKLLLPGFLARLNQDIYEIPCEDMNKSLRRPALKRKDRASCGEFGSELIIVKKGQLCSMELKLGIHIQLDKCGFVSGGYQLCGSCFDTLKKGKIPKFSAMNGVNVTTCQDYPPELEHLTLTEEYAIARSHPIGTSNRRVHSPECSWQGGQDNGYSPSKQEDVFALGRSTAPRTCV
jgi:hypothetical protein